MARMVRAKGKLGPVVATLNLKGGVGKTTVSANVFRVFYSMFKVPTLLVDFDPQFNLTQMLFDRRRYERELKACRTVMAVMEAPPSTSLFKVNTSSEPPPEPKDISTRFWYRKDNRDIDLRVVPGDFGLVKYSLMTNKGQLTKVQDRFLEFIRKCRQGGRVTVIDCNPSSSFLTICALRACTHLLVPVKSDHYSILGLNILDKFIASIPSIEYAPKKMILLNGVPRGDYESTIEGELRSDPKLGPATLVHPLHQSNILAAAPGSTGFATDKRVPHINRLRAEVFAVAKELAQLMGISP